MIKRLTNLEKRLVYQDIERKRVYRRLVAGLAWPVGQEPGAICLVGEDVQKDIGLSGRRLYVVKCFGARSAGALQRLAQEARVFWGADEWRADLANRAALRAFEEAGERYRESRRLPLCCGILSDARLDGLLRLSLELLRKERKLLHLEEGELEGAIKRLTPEDFKRPGAELPSLCALGLAVNELAWHTLGAEQVPQIKKRSNPYGS